MRAASIERWLQLDPSERRREAERASLNMDREALRALTEAFLIATHEGPRPPSEHTVRAYRRSVDLLIDLRGPDGLLSSSPEVGAGFVRALEDAGVKPSTLKVRMAGARALYHALAWAGVAISDPFRDIGVRSGSERGEERQPYSEAEVSSMLEAAGPTDRAMILLRREAGLSVGEMAALAWTDVDLAAARLTVPSGGGARRIAPLSHDLVEALGSLPRRGESVLGFTSDTRARQRLERLAVRAGVPYRGFQTLQPSAAAAAPARRYERRTGLGDRRRLIADPRPARPLPDVASLRAELDRMLAESQRRPGSFGVVTIRLEYLPAPSSSGDEVEEQVIQTSAARIDRVHRQYDIIARCANRTFCVVVKNLRSNSDLNKIVQRFQEALLGHPISLSDRTYGVTATIDTDVGQHALEDLLRRAS